MKKLVVLALISAPLCAMEDAGQEEDPFEELRRAVEGDHRSARSRMATSGYARALRDQTQLLQEVMVEQVSEQDRRLLIVAPHFGLVLQGKQKEMQALMEGKRVPLDTE